MLLNSGGTSGVRLRVRHLCEGQGNLDPDTRAETVLRAWTADEAYWPKMSSLSLWYSGVSAVTRGASTSRMKACLDSSARGSSNWTFAA